MPYAAAMGSNQANQNWWENFPWGLVSVILAAVALVVTIVIFLKTRKRKTLDYTLVDDVKILSDRISGMRSDIIVTVGGEVIKDPRILTVRYVNTGNQEILESDFLANSITTTDKSGTVNSELAGHSGNVAVTERGVVPHKTYAPDCLNPGDYIEIQYILDMDGIDSSVPFSPVCRIQGATRPSKLTKLREQRPSRKEFLMSLFLDFLRGAAGGAARA